MEHPVVIKKKKQIRQCSYFNSSVYIKSIFVFCLLPGLI